MSVERIVCLAGGVGAAKFLRGLVEVVEPERITAIVNTGDDIEMHGLHISPDLDIVMYTLAGIVDEEKGWGVRGDTFRCLEMLGRYGCETWFKLGDMDLATHILRTAWMRQGVRLSEVTRRLCERLGVRVRILPMTDDPVETRVVTDVGDLHFQEYLVKRGARDRVLRVYFKGIEEAGPAPGVLEAIASADAIVVCPSNPIVSIGPILSVKGIRQALKEAKGKVAAISPIVGGRPIKGPADKLMRGLGIEVSAVGVSKLYRDFLDYMVIDSVDEGLKRSIEAMGIRVAVTDTIMRSLEDKVRLARFVLSLLEG